MMSMPRALVALALFAAVACGPIPIDDHVSPIVPKPTAAATMNLGGNERLDHRIELRPEVLTVRGDAVPGATVRFTVSAGTIEPAIATTDANGYAVAVATIQNKVILTITVDGCPACGITTELIGPSTLPLPEMSLEPSCSTNGRTVTCRASGHVPGATLPLVSAQWLWGDGAYINVGSGNDTSHTYPAPGTYTISAFGTVADLRNAVAKITVQIQ